MKNAAHIAGKNVLIFGVCSLVYWAVGFGIAFGDGNRVIGDERLRALGRLAARDRPGAVLVLHDRPGRGRLPVRGRLRRRLARDRLGRDGRAREALGLLRLRRRLHADLLGHLALGLGRRLAVRAGDAGLRRLDGRALPGRAGRARRRAAARPAHRQVRGRPRERDPGPQHPLRRPRDDHPLVRLVRLQPGLDARRRHRRPGRLLRLRRGDDEPRGCGRRRQRRAHRLARAAQAGHLDDAERRPRRPGRRHRRERVRGAMGRGRDRPRLRRDRGRRRALRSSGSGSTTRSARSPSTASRASGARSPPACSLCLRSPRR